MGFTEAAGDCRVLMKAAVREAVATESRALARSDDASAANPDCRFPHLASEEAAPQIAASAGAPPSAARRGAPCAPTGATSGPSGTRAATASPGATLANVVRDGANGVLPPPGVDRRLFRYAPGVPTPVSHQAPFVNMDDSSNVPGTANPEIGRRRLKDMVVDVVARPWGRSVADGGAWVIHPCCRTCHCIHMRPHFGRGYCKPCYYRSPHVRERRFAQWVRHGRRLLEDDADARWLRLLTAASRKRTRDRKVGLEPDYSVLAYRITWKLFDERCAFCGALNDLTIDHHWPASEGVRIEPGNAVLLCRACNASKGTHPPDEFYSPEQLAVIERTLRMAAEFTFFLEALMPELDLRHLRGRAA